VRQMIIGTMVVGTRDTKKRFQQNEIDLFYNFAHHAAVAIGNAKLYEDSLEKITHLTMLYEIGKTLSPTLDIDEGLMNAMELLRTQLNYPLCALLSLNPETNELTIWKIAGRDYKEVKDRRYRVGVDGIVGWVAHTGDPLYVQDTSRDTRYIGGWPGMRSEAAFPLKVRDQVIGVLDVESNEINGFDEENLKVLASFASQVGIYIENARLFSNLKKTLQELKQAQDQIIQAEKLMALGEMASGVAHDFNNVLAVILGNIQLLLHQIDHLHIDEIRDRLRVIERSSKDGAETIRRIQEFTGVRRDKEFASVSVNEIVREVTIITQPRWKDQAQEKGIQIRLTTQLEDVPPVFGNPSELREVLTNIVFNAVDAMPNGGSITLSTRLLANRVEIWIADTGIGMMEDVKKRVFDPFFSTKGVTHSGLGMSVSYGIIKRHGGEIVIESQPGQGTTFILHLPVAVVEVGGEKTLPAAREVAPARILVIDDEDSVRDILTRILRTKGHQVVSASNGEEGIEQFKAKPFDMVFTDLGMPNISGWEVAKTIKKMNPKIPVAMITGWGMELNKEKMIENGIDLIISKPFNMEEVIRLVSEAVALKEQR
jgi:signal transduction histidine kinase/ActR/RegA family two-component response regulator